MTSVAALDDFLKTNGAVRPAPAVSSMSSVARLGWLRKTLQQLGIDAGFLAKADGLAERARSMRSDAVTASQQAAQRRF